MSDGLAPAQMPRVFGRRAAREALPVLDTHANKYTRGTVLVAGGSQEYPGAAILAARAASRAGAGYVRLAAPQDAAIVARNHLCSIPVTSCTQQDGAMCAAAAAEVLTAGVKSDVFVVGPGLTRVPAAADFLEQLLAGAKASVVLDADALNLLADYPQLATCLSSQTIVLTPHEGEAARLLGRRVANRLGDAAELAERFGCVVVLKGPCTIVTDGKATVECRNAGPELAKAGTGDVLAGMVGAFVAQCDNALEAAALAVYLHGSAAKLAASRLSALSVVPEDVIDWIGPAVVELTSVSKKRSR